MNLSKRWRYVLIAAVVFFLGGSIPFILRAFDKFQRLKITSTFALALQQQDFSEMAECILKAEREKLNVNEETIKAAFEHLRLPSIRLVKLEALEADPLWAMVRSWWTLPEGREVPVIIELTREEGRWRINFFLAFRRFCALKLGLQGMDKVEAFEKSRGWAQKILASVGIKGYVNPFGTVRAFDGKLLGTINP